jgi:hypothetical protein
MTILFKGQESTKKVDGQVRKVIPFAGTDRDGEFSQMGVGLIYPVEQTASIWGLVAPHDIVASYRGMKIAEEVPTFGHGTLAACWYASHRDVHPSDKRYIDDIEGMIGADTRQRILNTPLPSFDEAIQVMMEKGIDFDVYPFLAELDQDNLTRTPVLEKAVNDYSDRVLLFRGLSGDFGKAYESLTGKPKGLWERIRGRRIDPRYMEVAGSYVSMVEQSLPWLIPDVERQIGLLNEGVKDLSVDVEQNGAESRETVEQARAQIYDNQAKLNVAAADLRQASVGQATPNRKFVAYHTALDAMVRSASDVARGLSTLAIYAGREEPSGQEFTATKGLAESVVQVINRTAREQMQGAYALR